jgi:hypothetical protein
MIRKASSLGLTLLLAGATLATAQDRKPLSPAWTSATMVGGTWSAPDKDGERRYTGGKWIEVSYSRPMLRGRADIFGKGADYGKAVADNNKDKDGAFVWRAGANQTTKLTTEVPLMMGGKRLEPGSYDLFVILKEGGWTLIVSTQPTQEKYDANDKTKIWGAYGYDTKYDVVLFTMKITLRSRWSVHDRFQRHERRRQPGHGLGKDGRHRSVHVVSKHPPGGAVAPCRGAAPHPIFR